MPSAIGSIIVRVPGICGGRPTIAGTRILVQTIALDTSYGDSPEEIAENRPHLSLPQIHAALEYYEANKEEIDADIEADRIAYEEGAAAARA